MMEYRYGLINDKKSHDEAMVSIETLEIACRVLEFQKNRNVSVLHRQMVNTLLGLKSEVRRYRASQQNLVHLPVKGIADFNYYKSTKYDKED